MTDLEAVANNLALARRHVDENDTDTAALYYDTTLQYMKSRMSQVIDRATADQYNSMIRLVKQEMSRLQELIRLQKSDEGAYRGASSAAARQRHASSCSDAVVADDGFRPAVTDHGAAEQPRDPQVWGPPGTEPRGLARQTSSAADYKPPVGKSRLPQWALQATRGNQPGALASNAAAPAAAAPAAAPANYKRKPAVPTRQVAARVDAQQQQQHRPGGAAAAAAAGAGAGGAAARRAPGGTPPPGSLQYSGPDGDLWANLARDVLDQSLNVKFDDIAGLEDAKRILQEAITLPMLVPEYFTGIRRPVKGVMMFGPPGTGKTLLARAVASECACTFFSVSTSTLASKYRGESEKMVRVLFEMARHHAPSVIFIDEIDSLATQRGAQGEHEASRRVKAELLTQLDGIHSVADGEERRHVMVLSATNFPWDIDEALRRRLEKRIYIPLPEQQQRLELLRINCRGVVLAPDVDLAEIARQTAGYSGDDITNICRDAAMEPMRRNIAGLAVAQIREKLAGRSVEAVSMADFLTAVARVNPSVSQEDITRHEQYQAQYGAT